MTTATKREQLEKLIPQMKTHAGELDAKAAKDEPIEQAAFDALVKMTKDVKTLKADLLTEAKNVADAAAAGLALEDAEKFLTDLGINPNAKSADNASTARPGGAPSKLKISEQFINSEQYKTAMARFPNGRIPEKGGITMDAVAFKTLLTGADAASGGAFVWSDRTGIFDPGAFQRPLTFRDVITNSTTSSDTVDYAQMTGFTNAAVPVAEATSSDVIDGSTVTAADGGLKPESTLAFLKVTATVRTIAHWIPVTRRALSDAGQLSTIIDNFLRYGLEEQLEDQMVAGGGTGEDLQGITGLSGIQTHALGGDTLLDGYRKAKTKVRLVGRATANAYLMHPNDWQNVDLLQNNEGGYYFGGPANPGQPRLWGLPVVESEACTEGTAFVADFNTMVLWDREQASITMSDSHADFFTRNLLAILAEMRAAYGALRPSAIVKITGV